jgi:hypothetical protein
MIGIDDLEHQLRATLQPPELPPVAETWRRLQPRLGRQRVERRRLGTPLRVALAVVVLLVLSSSLALASSSDLRDYLSDVASGRASMVGGQVTDSGIRSLYPAPRYTILQPSTLPDGWGFVGYGYHPAPVEVGPVNVPRPDGVIIFSRIAGRDVPGDVVSKANARTRQLLSQTPGQVLALLYAREQQQLAEVVERPVSSDLPVGEPTTVHGLAAVRVSDGGREMVAWVEQGTLLEVSTTTGRAETARLADAVQVTLLVPFQKTEAGRQLLSASPTPPASPDVPLSHRVGPLAIPLGTREEIVRQCGWAPPVDNQPPSQAGDQVRCAALLAAGLTNPQEGWGFDFSPWTRAAERLGIDPSAGPAGDPLVYLVHIEVTNYAGSVVVLDAASGEPYLLVRLLPVPFGPRLGPSETPHATREQVVQTCGWKPEMATQAAGLFPPQTRCAARLIAGNVADPANWSFDRAHWHEAAARLGIDPAIGPPTDPLVYVIEADVADSGGSIVVVDAGTGEPYLLVHPQPGA